MTPTRTQPRICFVATGLAKGGAEAQLFRATSGLRARGFDVHVVSMLWFDYDYYGAKLAEQGVPVTYLDASRTMNPVRILARFLRYARALRPVALAGFDYPGTMLARAGGAAARIPVVISSIRSENLGTSLRRLALAWTDSWGTVTTTNSHAVARKLVAVGAASPRRVRVIPNGLDLHAVGPHLRRDRAALRRSLGVDDSDFFWVAAGNLNPPKDYPNLLAATAPLVSNRLPVKLAIAGAGPLLAELRQQVATLGLDRTVSFLGRRDDVPSCMAAADATVLASAWESSPNVVIESLAVGTPVVCTDVGGVREIVQDGRSGFIVPPRSAAALAAAMATMMDPSTPRAEMGSAGRKHVEENFALDHVVGRWSDLFTELLSVPAR